MGKKGKKKTVASTKKIEKTPEQLEQERQAKEEKKLLKKIFGTGKKKKSQQKAAEAKVVAAAKKEEQAVQAKELKMEEAKQEQKKQEEKREAKLEEKKHEPKPPKEKKPRKPLLTDSQKQKARGALLVLVGLFMIGFVGYFLYTRLFRPQSLAHFLPKDGTVGFLEVNIDGESDQGKKFTKLFEKYPVYHAANLVQLASLILPVDYKNEIEPWIGRKIGIVLMKQTGDDDSVKLLMFVENKSSEKTLNFLKGRALANAGDELLTETYNGYTIYRYKVGQNYSFSFVNNYLVLAGSDALLKQILDAQGSGVAKLQDDPTFQKVNNNLPPYGLMFGYANTQSLFETLLKNPLFQGQKSRDLVALQPFMKMFAAQGFTMVVNDRDLTIQVFEAIDRSQLQGETYLTYSEKYEGKLLELASENSILFAGGHDMYKEIKRIGEIFGNGASIDSTIFNGILEAQKDKYFGKDISLDADVYPLLKNEYLITVENNFETPVISVFMNLSDKNEDMIRVEKLVSAFIKKRAIFSPQIREVTLPDGTKGQEIVASAEDITRVDAPYDGHNATMIKLGNLPWSISYAVLDNTLLISTSPANLNAMIDRKTGKMPNNLRVSDSFTRTVLPAMRSADEIFNIRLGALTPVLGLDQNPAVKPYIEGFNSMTMAKNFFDDGISTLYVIDVL